MQCIMIIFISSNSSKIHPNSYSLNFVFFLSFPCCLPFPLPSSSPSPPHTSSPVCIRCLLLGFVPVLENGCYTMCYIFKENQLSLSQH